MAISACVLQNTAVYIVMSSLVAAKAINVQVDPPASIHQVGMIASVP